MTRAEVRTSTVVLAAAATSIAWMSDPTDPVLAFLAGATAVLVGAFGYLTWVLRRIEAEISANTHAQRSPAGASTQESP